MKSRAFSCNRVLLRKNLRRFWPAMLIVGLLMLMSVVLPQITILSFLRERVASETLAELGTSFCSNLSGFSLIYAAIAAGCTFGYLHNKKSSFMLHAFPITRDCLFTTNYLSGLLLFLIPYAPIGLLTFVLPVLYGYVWPQLLLGALLCVLQFVFFYSLAVFCMQLSGKRSFAIFCYFVLNFIAPITEGMFSLMLEPYLFGLDSSSMAISIYLSPYLYLNVGGLSALFEMEFTLPWLYTLVIFAVGIALSYCALLLYRRRPIECVGQSVCFRKTTALIHVIQTLVIALGFGMLFYALTPVSDQTFKLVCVLVAGYFGYMLLNKPMRHEKIFSFKALLRYSVLALVIIAVDLTFRFDLLNITYYVPEPSEVRSVSLNSGEDIKAVTIEDPELIEDFCDLHAQLIEDYDSTIDIYEYYSYTELDIVYTLDDGATVERSYYLIEDAASQEEIIAQAYQIFTSGKFNEAYLDALRERVIDAELFLNAQSLTGQQLDGLFDALEKDIQSPQDLYLHYGYDDDPYTLNFAFPAEEDNYTWYEFFQIPKTAKHAREYLDSIYVETGIIR